MDWINLTQYRDLERAAVTEVMSLWVLLKVREVLV
jgi:hypothetical protein